ncbi:MAG: stage 0 sporulation family protein [Defluviitaleaceae bacterium]|nr:stage 0 sporulation family protein [Defluviitaleaceae bacterium]
MFIVGVRFKDVGKVYYFDPGKFKEEELTQGTPVVVETGRGAEYGIVAMEKHDTDIRGISQPIRKVLRLATPEDTEQEKSNRRREEEAREICLEKIKTHKLEMHLVDVELTFDHSKIIFFFTADGRVDFRELVKDLAATFRMRIELRQIGVRDEAKMLSGIGICGRILCCSSFLDEFQPVSIKSAKDQGLSLNPTKISGICGKLMCCLKYEEETYAHLMKGMPGVGDLVRTPAGDGDVLSINILRQTAKVSVGSKSGEDPTIDTYPVNEITILEHRPQCERGCNCAKCKGEKHA